MAIIALDELPKLKRKYQNKKIVFCSGSFDLLHAGHVLFFEDCQRLGDILIVALGSRQAITEYKGKGPILNDALRIKMLDSLRQVDYVFLDKTPNLEALLKSVFAKLKPDYYVINEDAQLIAMRQKLADEFKVKLVILKRECPSEYENISTSKIIALIKASK